MHTCSDDIPFASKGAGPPLPVILTTLTLGTLVSTMPAGPVSGIVRRAYGGVVCERGIRHRDVVRVLPPDAQVRWRIGIFRHPEVGKLHRHFRAEVPLPLVFLQMHRPAAPHFIGTCRSGRNCSRVIWRVIANDSTQVFGAGCLGLSAGTHRQRQHCDTACSPSEGFAVHRKSPCLAFRDSPKRPSGDVDRHDPLG